MTSTPLRSKSPLHSKTIWGGAMAIAAGLPALVQTVAFIAGHAEPVSPEPLSTAVLSIMGGVSAIVGRWVATQPVRLKQHGHRMQ